jgi:starvation-inducible DNA-binding protein
MEEHEEMAWMLRSFIEGQALEPDGKQQTTETKVPVGV